MKAWSRLALGQCTQNHTTADVIWIFCNKSRDCTRRHTVGQGLRRITLAPYSRCAPPAFRICVSQGTYDANPCHFLRSPTYSDCVGRGNCGLLSSSWARAVPRRKNHDECRRPAGYPVASRQYRLTVLSDCLTASSHHPPSGGCLCMEADSTDSRPLFTRCCRSSPARSGFLYGRSPTTDGIGAKPNGLFHKGVRHGIQRPERTPRA